MQSPFLFLVLLLPAINNSDLIKPAVFNSTVTAIKQIEAKIRPLTSNIQTHETALPPHFLFVSSVKSIGAKEISEQGNQGYADSGLDEVCCTPGLLK